MISNWHDPSEVILKTTLSASVTDSAVALICTVSNRYLGSVSVLLMIRYLPLFSHAQSAAEAASGAATTLGAAGFWTIEAVTSATVRPAAAIPATMASIFWSSALPTTRVSVRELTLPGWSARPLPSPRMSWRP